MDRNFTKSLALVLKHEGGWSDHPKDPGGATMKGVTLANFRRYVKADATKADLRKITDAQLATVYRRFYWDAVAAGELPDGVDFAVFDFAVNSGPARAAKYLQAVVNAKQDGRIGPATLAAVGAVPRAKIINTLCDNRLAFMQSLKKLWPTFKNGWTARVKDVRSKALAMASVLPTSTVAGTGGGAGAYPGTYTPVHVSPDGPLSGPVPEKPGAEVGSARASGGPLKLAVGAFLAGLIGLGSWLAGLQCDLLGVLCK